MLHATLINKEINVRKQSIQKGMVGSNEIREKIREIPDKPGVYQFFDRNGNILYIGKAKKLNKRVSSYFNKAGGGNYKKDVLVGKIVEVKYILVESESDALLLENNLIKEYRPKYNVLLKDDKTFPWICIKKEPFPRVFYTRKVLEDGSEYYGPYTSVMMIKTLFGLIRQLYKLRTCNFLLNSENIEKKKFKKCLEYHIGNCKAPCEGLQDEKDYDTSIDQIQNILKGNLHQVIDHLQKTMKVCAEAYRFEDAEQIRISLEILERYRSKSTIVNPSINDVDVFSFIDGPEKVYVNVMKVVKGAIIQSHNVEIVKRIEESREDILAIAMINLRQRLGSHATEIILPFIPSVQLPHVNYVLPKKGDKKRLLELSARNANVYRMERSRILETSKRTEYVTRTLDTIKHELRLRTVPQHIECIDISNIQGRSSVASCVVFKSGKPSKNEYRHYHIKTVSGANDFASMEEIVSRRFRYLRENKIELPDLLVIDGGKGQLGAALKSIRKLGMEGQTAIIGIAKKLEEIYLPGDPLPLYLDKNSASLKLIQRIRNEAHRFGISFHRNERSKSMLLSELDGIRGIGPVSRDRLLAAAPDMEGVKKMDALALEKIVGKRAAKILYMHFHKTL